MRRESRLAADSPAEQRFSLQDLLEHQLRWEHSWQVPPAQMVTYSYPVNTISLSSGTLSHV